MRNIIVHEYDQVDFIDLSEIPIAPS